MQQLVVPLAVPASGTAPRPSVGVDRSLAVGVIHRCAALPPHGVVAQHCFVPQLTIAHASASLALRLRNLHRRRRQAGSVALVLQLELLRVGHGDVASRHSLVVLVPCARALPAALVGELVSGIIALAVQAEQSG